MPMEYFGDAFPELAQAECRVLTVVEGDEDLPADRYALVEMYCNERGCDCRRVLLNVVSETTGESQCMINYGLEPHDPMRGPFIDPMSPRKKSAGELLHLIDTLALSDLSYVARLKRHYQLFKDSDCGNRRFDQAFGFVRLSPEQVATRISERKQRHKALRRARRRGRAR